MKSTVRLAHAPNPDIAGGYWAGKSEGQKRMDVPVDSLDQAAARCRAYCEELDLGGGNWAGGAIFEHGVQIARVSYNGRVWDLQGKEIPSPYTPAGSSNVRSSL